MYSQLVDIQQKAGEFTDEDFFNSLDPWYIEQDEEATDAICRRVGIGRRFKVRHHQFILTDIVQFDLSQVVNLLELARDPSTLDQYRAWSALEWAAYQRKNLKSRLQSGFFKRGRIFLGESSHLSSIDVNVNQEVCRWICLNGSCFVMEDW